jgi:hypothetical protein
MLLMLALLLLLHHADVCAGQPAAGLRRLSVEYRQRPQDIGVGVPTFSWEIVDHARGITQSGFTLTVTSLAANISRGQCMGSHRTPSQPVEDPLDPLQIGKSHRKRARTTCSVRVPSLARL